MSLFDWGRFSPDHWFADLSDPIDGPSYLALAIVQTLLLAAATFARLVADVLLADRPEARQLVSDVAGVAAILAGLGLVVLLFRWHLLVPFLTKRAWLYAWGLALALAAGWAAWRTRRLGAAT